MAWHANIVCIVLYVQVTYVWQNLFLLSLKQGPNCNSRPWKSAFWTEAHEDEMALCLFWTGEEFWFDWSSNFGLFFFFFQDEKKRGFRIAYFYPKNCFSYLTKLYSVHTCKIRTGGSGIPRKKKKRVWCAHHFFSISFEDHKSFFLTDQNSDGFN